MAMYQAMHNMIAYLHDFDDISTITVDYRQSRTKFGFLQDGFRYYEFMIYLNKKENCYFSGLGVVETFTSMNSMKSFLIRFGRAKLRQEQNSLSD